MESSVTNINYVHVSMPVVELQDFHLFSDLQLRNIAL